MTALSVYISIPICLAELKFAPLFVICIVQHNLTRITTMAKFSSQRIHAYHRFNCSNHLKIKVNN